MRSVVIAQPAFAEPMPIIPVWSQGVATIDCLGDEFHFACFLEQRGFSGEDALEKIINLRTIMPVHGVARALPDIIRMLPKQIGNEVIGAAMRMLR